MSNTPKFLLAAAMDHARMGHQLDRADAALLVDEIDRLRARAEAAEQRVESLTKDLQEIADSHLPDQPAAFDMSDYDWAVKHIRYLRAIARRALSEIPNAQQ